MKGHAKRFILATLALVALMGFQHGDDARIATTTVDPRVEQVSMYWKDRRSRVIGNIGALQTMLQAQGQTMTLAMNGGMYTVDHAPLGLYVENGREIIRLNTSSGEGNFHLMPNGVFGIRSDTVAFVCTTSEYPGVKAVSFATQSGPMLLVHGRINEKFMQGSLNLNIRNGVGLRADGQLVFAISKEPVNFYDFASAFIAAGCTDALYLDGFVSKAYMPGEGLEQLDGELGVLIAVSKRNG